MRAQRLSRKPQEVIAGVILTLLLGGFGALGRVFQAQPASSIRSGSPANGTYLYGEDPQPNRIGKGYVVFSHQNGKVVGAFYYPRSEFDCFAGSLRNNTLDVESTGADSPEVVTVKVNLSDLHPIPTVSGQDQQMLSVCKQETTTPLSRQLGQFLSALPRPEKSGLTVASV